MKFKETSCETEHLTVAGAFMDILSLLWNNSYKQIFQYDLQEQVVLCCLRKKEILSLEAKVVHGIKRKFLVKSITGCSAEIYCTPLS